MRGALIKCSGWIRKKYKAKKGYTLIEVIAAIAISTIVLAMGFTLVISSYKTYVNMVNKSIRKDEIDNALLSIDRMVTGKMMKDISFNTARKEILINYLNDDDDVNVVNSKTIKRDGEKLKIYTLKIGGPKGGESGWNTILDKVGNFEVIKKGNIHYYKITLKTGEVIIQCI